MKTYLNKVKPYIFGFLVAVLVMSGYMTYVRWSALVKAWNYPEVVSSLKVDKTFEVKK